MWRAFLGTADVELIAYGRYMKDVYTALLAYLRGLIEIWAERWLIVEGNTRRSTPIVWSICLAPFLDR